MKKRKIGKTEEERLSTRMSTKIRELGKLALILLLVISATVVMGGCNLADVPIGIPSIITEP